MRITVGVSTWLGLIGGAAGVVVPFIGELADSTAPLGIGPDLWFKAGAVLVGLTIIGRAAQAVAVFLRGGEA